MVDSSGRRPADVYLPEWSCGTPLALEVMFTNPSQITTTLAARRGNSESWQAAIAKNDEKNTLYSGQRQAQGVTFMAVAVCCFGGWLPCAEELVKELASRSAAYSGSSQGMVC